MEACMVAGMDDYLVKPFSIEEMLVKVSLIPESENAPPVDEAFHSKNTVADADPVVDVASFVVELGEETAFKLLRLFVKSGKSHLEDIKVGIATEDMARIKLAAHKLKGTAGQYRAPGIVAPADRLSTIENRADIENVAKDFDLLKIEFAKATDVISNTIGKKA